MKATSRRQFLQAAAAGTGLALMLPHLAKAGKYIPGNILDRTTLTSASHWGILEAQSVGGRLVSVAPFIKDPDGASPILQALADRVYSETRVKYPMVREDYLRHGYQSDRTERGNGKFVRVSWEEAFDLVASELLRVKKTYGNSAIQTDYSGIWSAVGKLHKSGTLMRRMLGLHGGYTDGVGNFSFGAAMVLLPHIMGGIVNNEQQTAWPSVIEHSELIVLWGSNLLKNNQVGTSPTDHTTYGYIKTLKAKGTKVISIDPIVTDAARYLNAEQISIRPNTDTAFMLALAHTLYTENLYDKTFIAKYTHGFDKFVPYLLGQEDGVAKTPAWAAAITEIPADKIVSLARTLASHRTMLMCGWSLQRAHHGEQAYWMLVTLASMLGQIGLPGTGFGMCYHESSGGSLTANGVSPGGISAGPNAVKEGIPVVYLPDALLHPGKKVPYDGRTITYPDIKLIYVAGSNPLSHQMNRNRQIQAWQRPETIIVNEQFWSNTAKFADIVLPVTTPFERNDIDVASGFSFHYIVALHKLIEPLFEAKSDYDVFAEISRRLGFGDKFTEGKSEMDWLHSFYATAVAGAKAKGVAMPDFDTFWKAGTFEFPIPEAAREYAQFSDFRADPFGNALGTPSGQIEIFSETISGFKYDDCPGHPVWLEPAEWLGNTQADTYPLHILSPHPKFRLHSQMDNTWLRDTYEVAGREPIWINPADAKMRHISSGDIVRVFNGRGALLAGAVVTERVRERVVMLQEGAWYDPDQPGKQGALCKHGSVNVLTSDRGSSKLAQANTPNTTLVQVERYEQAAPAVTAFDVPGGEGTARA